MTTKEALSPALPHIASALGLPKGARLTFVVKGSSGGSFLNCYDVAVYAKGEKGGTVYLWDGVTFREYVLVGRNPDVRLEGGLPLPRDRASFLNRFSRALEKARDAPGSALPDPNVGRRFYSYA